MNPMSDNLSDEAFIAQIQQGAKAIQPNADFAADLEQQIHAVAQSREYSARTRLSGLIRLMGSAAAVLLLVSVGIFAVPPLRALAQQIIDFVTRASSDKIILGLSSFKSFEYQIFTSIEEAELVLSREIVAPQTLFSASKGSQNLAPLIQQVTYRSSGDTVTIVYQALQPTPNSSGLVQRSAGIQWWMWFSQTPSDLYHSLAGGIKVGESAQIETLTLDFRGHEVTAQYIRGSWNAGRVTDEEEAAMESGEMIQKEMTWVDSGTFKLIWEDAGVVYSLSTFEEDMYQLTRNDVIRIAESIE